MREEQYRLHAYVCGAACIQRFDMPGTVSFTWIYQRRPKDCRYAVAGAWSSDKRREDVIVWDLFTVWKQPDGSLVTPVPFGKHSDVDAAIMATAMLYEDK